MKKVAKKKQRTEKKRGPGRPRNEIAGRVRSVWVTDDVWQGLQVRADRLGISRNKLAAQALAMAMQ